MAKSHLLLLHGALGSQEQFDPWVAELQDHFQVHRLDFQGHGSKPFPNGPFRIESFAEDLKEYIQSHQLGPADIFGYSMGGYVALYLALQQPELIKRIFTFATKLDWQPETSAKEVKMLNPDTILSKVPHFAKMLEERHHGNDWRGHLERTAEMMLDLGDSPRLDNSAFQSIAHPVLMGLGDRDKMVGLDETYQTYRQLPHSQFLVLPGTPHPIEKINLNRLKPHILDFFN